MKKLFAVLMTLAVLGSMALVPGVMAEGLFDFAESSDSKKNEDGWVEYEYGGETYYAYNDNTAYVEKVIRSLPNIGSYRSSDEPSVLFASTIYSTLNDNEKSHVKSSLRQKLRDLEIAAKVVNPDPKPVSPSASAGTVSEPLVDANGYQYVMIGDDSWLYNMDRPGPSTSGSGSASSAVVANPSTGAGSVTTTAFALAALGVVAACGAALCSKKK